jgi:hypothetical protein
LGGRATRQLSAYLMRNFRQSPWELNILIIPQFLEFRETWRKASHSRLVFPFYVQYRIIYSSIWVQLNYEFSFFLRLDIRNLNLMRS